MSGLSTFQSGPKGSKRVQNGKPKCFWLCLDSFGSFQTNFFCPMRTKKGLAEVLLKKKRSQIVKNIEVYHFGPFWAFLYHFGMLTSLPCLAIFVWFIGAPSVHHLSSFYLSIVLSFHLSVFFVFLSFCLFIFRVFRISFFSSFCLIVFLSKLFFVHLNS